MSRLEYLDQRARRLTAALAEVERERTTLQRRTATFLPRQHREENLARLASGLPLRPADV
jgi:hypothetical protein